VGLALELAVALAAIAVRVGIAYFVRPETLDTEGWSGVAADVASAVAASAGSAAPARAGITRAMLDSAAVREFDVHMTSGGRYVGDLPDSWRTERDRLQLTRDARREFVRASSIAAHMPDLYRQAQAEVAIAGCWLWVPSVEDAKKATTTARTLLARARTFGGPVVEQAYQEVTELSRAFEPPVSSAAARPAGRPARTVLATPVPNTGLGYDHWAEVGSVAIRFHRRTVRQAEYDAGEPDEEVTPSGIVIPTSARWRLFTLRDEPGEDVPLVVRNSRSEWIAIMIVYDTIGVVFPTAQNTLQAEHRVPPGAETEIFLKRPDRDARYPRQPAMTFTLPGPR
jgi:hypothetical protein